MIGGFGPKENSPCDTQKIKLPDQCSYAIYVFMSILVWTMHARNLNKTIPIAICPQYIIPIYSIKTNQIYVP